MTQNVYRLAVACLFLTMMGIVAGLASPGLADTDLGIVDTQVHLPVILTTTLLYILVLTRLLVDPQRYFHASRMLVISLPLLIYCLASASWSGDPMLSVRRSLFLVLTVVIGIIIGSDFAVAELIGLLAAASIFHLVLCAAFYAVAPHYLFSPQDARSLKGLTTHKNVFGFEQGVSVLALMYFPIRHFRWVRWPLTATAFAALLLSHSSGSLLATILALVCWPVLQIVRLRREERLPIALFLTAATFGFTALFISNLQRIPELFSKDATLSGRTQLWSVLLVSIQQHLWFGYGFESFWQGLQGESLNVIRAVGWLVPTAHNGYLDLLLSGGVVGAVLFFPLLIIGVRRALLFTAESQEPSRFFPILFIVFWLVYNLNESALLTRSGLPFFLFIAITTSLAVPHPAPGPVAKNVSFEWFLEGAHPAKGA